MSRHRAIRIATRGSELALRQARLVQEGLRRAGADAELVTFSTVGDRRLEEPLREIGAKGLFTQELEAALVAGEVDCCVHSLKDLPTDMAGGTGVVALLPREDPRDVLVVRAGIAGESLESLPHGARVGTSSLRRRAQLLASRPDVDVRELRGNVPTRLRKVNAGEVDAAILAAAGLHRLDAQDRIACYLDAPAWLPAAGQGAIAVQARTTRDEQPADDAARMLAGLNDAPTALAAHAERALLAFLDGGCQVPIGALAVREGGRQRLYALVAAVDGSRVVRGDRLLEPGQKEDGPFALANELLARGGREILQSARAGGPVPSPQPE